MKIYIGIDDTDNLETRGTGFQARSLGMSLMESELFQLKTVTRHQLLVDRRIPFTSHNSSACLVGEALAPLEEVIAHCRDFLIRESAHDSDAGLCVASEDNISESVTGFGVRAKREVLTLEEALALSEKNGVYLEGFLNARIGMIGSLAAVGLRFKGEDGRLLWTDNLRETQGVFQTGEYRRLTGIEKVVGLDGTMIKEEDVINITEWCRPVMNQGYITLFVEKIENNTVYDYQSASKEYIKSISE